MQWSDKKKAFTEIKYTPSNIQAYISKLKNIALANLLDNSTTNADSTPEERTLRSKVP